MSERVARPHEEAQASRDEWRMIDHPVEVALGHAYQWSSAVRTQAYRVIYEGDDNKITDAYLLVLAVRNILRAAEMAKKHLPGHPKDELTAAIAAFEAALPGLLNARDALDHFDEYTQGIGNLQQPEVKDRRKRVPDEKAAQAYRVDFDYADAPQSFDRPRLHVGPHIIEIAAAGAAATRLTNEIWAAAKHRDGEPVPRAFLDALD